MSSHNVPTAYPHDLGSQQPRSIERVFEEVLDDELAHMKGRSPACALKTAICGTI